MQYSSTRLDLSTAEIVKLLVERKYKVCSPIDITFTGETCRIAIHHGFSIDYMIIHRSADTNLHFDLESKSLEYLYVDANNPRL